MSKEVKMPNYGRGALYALAGPVVGILLWILLWEWNFIASIATFAMAWLTVKLYKKGAKQIDFDSLVIIIAYIVVGMIAAFFVGVLDDVIKATLNDWARKDGLTYFDLLHDSRVWNFMPDYLFSKDFWNDYGSSVFIALGLGVLGVYGTVKGVAAEAFAYNKEAQ